MYIGQLSKTLCCSIYLCIGLLLPLSPVFAVTTLIVDLNEDAVSQYVDTLFVEGNLGGGVAFTPQTYSGSFGAFFMGASGNWFYSASNTQSAIQGLAAGQLITDSFVVRDATGNDYTVQVNIHGVNDVAVFSGVDYGSIVEDDDSYFSGVLVASGKLAVQDADIGESGFINANLAGTFGFLYLDSSGTWFYLAQNDQPLIQSMAAGEHLTETFSVSSIDGTQHTVTIDIDGVNDAAQISGVDAGTVVEDADTPFTNILLASGKLEISDMDSGEAAFVGASLSGQHGFLYVDEAGYWTYLAQNSQPAIQSLSSGEVLQEAFSVRSIDGTGHSVSVTIEGVNEVPANRTIDLSWFAPANREDGSSVPLTEIAGYRIYVGMKSGDYIYDKEITGAAVQSVQLNGVPAGTYYLVMTTFDNAGRESLYSEEHMITLQ